MISSVVHIVIIPISTAEAVSSASILLFLQIFLEMELLERVARSTRAFIKVLLPLYIWVDIITNYMVVHAWKVLCDDNEKLNCLYWKLGLTFCLLPSIVFITFGILFAWWRGELNGNTGLLIIAFGAFYQITFPVLKLCAIGISLSPPPVRLLAESDVHNATWAFGVFEAVFELVPPSSEY